jgi:hypothetical protein
MPWAKVDDQFTDHVKVVGLSLAARGMWLCGLVYAARRSTDGFIPASIPQREAAGEDAAPYVQELLDAGLWDRADGGYQIHDYLKYNPSKDDLDAVRIARSEAGAKGAESRWGNKPMANAMANAMANGSQTDAPYPYPIPIPVSPAHIPDPDPVVIADKPQKSPRKRRMVPDDWQPDDKGREFARGKGMDTDAVIDNEVTRFRDWHLSKGTLFLDIPAAWRTWCGNYREYNRSKPNGNGRGPKGPDFAERARQMEAAERAAMEAGR